MGRLAVGLAFVVGGSLAESPTILLLGLVVVLFEGVRLLWSRRGLGGVEYRRHLPHRQCVVGDELPLDITVWNRKRLPLAWLKADDVAGNGIVVRERQLVESATGQTILRNSWTLAPFERVVRHFHLVAERRGVYELGPAHLEVGRMDRSGRFPSSRPPARAATRGVASRATHRREFRLPWCQGL